MQGVTAPRAQAHRFVGQDLPLPEVQAQRAGPVGRSTVDPPQSPRAVVDAFYRAFQARNFDRMEALYHPDVKFKDMVFEYGDRAGTMKMWRQILSTPGIKMGVHVGEVDGDTVRGHWAADYQVFGRPVHNELTFEMKVKDGKIVEHRDHSDWNRWAPQAFPAGALFTLPGLKQLAIGILRMRIDG